MKRQKQLYAAIGLGLADYQTYTHAKNSPWLQNCIVFLAANKGQAEKKARKWLGGRIIVRQVGRATVNIAGAESHVQSHAPSFGALIVMDTSDTGEGLLVTQYDKAELERAAAAQKGGRA